MYVYTTFFGVNGAELLASPVFGSRAYWRPNGATLDFGAEEGVGALME
jgi:hypothetical protein